MASPFPMLHDEGVALRNWTEEDVDVLVEACNDAALREQLPVPVPYTAADASAYVALAAEGWARAEQFIFAVTDSATGEVVGSVRIGPSPGGATAGYWTTARARRRGLATAALRLVTEWASARGLSPVRLYVSPTNVASQRVATKAGYRRTADDAIIDPEHQPGDFVYVTR